MTRSFILSMITVLALGGFTMASENMVGRQSQNEGVTALPAPAKMTIDGDLSDWDWSGRIEVFAEHSLRGRYSVEMAAMWDKDNLYLGAKWNDPTPMFSMVNPQFNPDKGWLSDAWQMRFKTDQTVHITNWFYAAEQKPCISVSYSASGGRPKALKLLENGSFEQGLKLAYKKNEKGFTQEVCIPWKFLYKKVPAIGPNMTFRMGNEFLWGDITGKTWPMHRYADNMQPGVTSREFYWSNWKAWGNMTLAAKGNIKPRVYVIEGQRPEGTIPVQVTIPANAARFTIAIDNAKGERVRNLAGDFQAQDYQVKTTGKQTTVEVLWDGKGDNGEYVAPGSYTARGLTHTGIGAEYDMCYYNPGTPHWATPKGNGAWGGDHGNPCGVARAGDWVIVTWAGAEGGSGIIGVGPDGLKKWGEKRGASLITANATYAFGIMGREQKLCRYDVKTGAYRPFTQNSKQLQFELPVSTLISMGKKVLAVAANEGSLLLATDAGQVVILDTETAAVRKSLSVTGVSAIALKGQTCVGIVKDKVCRISLKSGKTSTWRTPGLRKPSAIAIDTDGNVVVFDAGSDLQVKAYSRDGKQVYSCGKRGGRPLRGKYEEQGLRAISSIAVDARGKVWTVEKGMDPRRVAIWNKDGSLFKDYIGNTAYAGTGSYLNEDEPDYAYIGSLRFKLDRKTRTSKLVEILWAPRLEKNEAFPLWSHAHHFSNPGFVKSKASGKEKTYIYHNGMYSRYHAIHMKRNGCWQPVAAICELSELKKRCPNVKMPEGKHNTVVIWNDLNGDGVVHPDELMVCKQKISLAAGWNHHAGRDLSIYTRGITRIKPVRFTDDGAPVYGEEGITRYGKQAGCLVPVEDENLLLCMGTNRFPNACKILCMDINTGKPKWTYPNPYPGVHGSHRAPMPKPGMIIGVLKITGVAEVNKEVGRVFSMRGNLGQDVYMTSDGLFVGAMFSDGRLPGASLPATESALVGQPLDAFSHGSEPFQGWFGKQSDGKIRMLCGLPREAVMIAEITGLESIRRFKPVKLNLDAQAIAKARAFNSKPKATKSAPTHYTVKRVKQSPFAKSWNGIPALNVTREGVGESAKFQLAYDGDKLYWRSEVTDRSAWKNLGKEFTRLFKTGDCVDLNLSVKGKGKNPKAGDMRVLIAKYNGKATAVLMQVEPFGPTKGQKVTYRTGWARTLKNVAILEDARIREKVQGSKYVIEAAIPLASLGIRDLRGKELGGDLGFISGDAAGRINVARTYWANKDTNLVSDEPFEAWLYPSKWGTLIFE